MFAPYYSLAIRQLTHQNHEHRPRGSPPSESVKQEGVVKQVSSYVWLSHLLKSLLFYLLVHDTIAQWFYTVKICFTGFTVCCRPRLLLENTALRPVSTTRVDGPS